MKFIWTLPLERAGLLAVGLAALLVAGAYAVAYAGGGGSLASLAAAAAFLVLVAAGMYAWRRGASGRAT